MEHKYVLSISIILIAVVSVIYFNYFVSNEDREQIFRSEANKFLDRDVQEGKNFSGSRLSTRSEPYNDTVVLEKVWTKNDVRYVAKVKAENKSGNFRLYEKRAVVSYPGDYSTEERLISNTDKLVELNLTAADRECQSNDNAASIVGKGYGSMYCILTFENEGSWNTDVLVVDSFNDRNLLKICKNKGGVNTCEVR